MTNNEEVRNPEIVKRTILEMSENELEAVIKVILPGRFLHKYSKADLQEVAIYWILKNGLRVTHKFTLIKMDDDSYGLLTVKDGCNCCRKSVQSGTNQGAEKGNATKRLENSSQPEMAGSIVEKETNQIKPESNHGSQSAIIRVQPLPTSLSPNDAVTKTDEDSKTNRKRFFECCAEFGSCCISLLSNC